MWACGEGGSITPLKMPMLKARSEDIGLLSVSKEDQQIQMKYLNSVLSTLSQGSG